MQGSVRWQNVAKPSRLQSGSTTERQKKMRGLTDRQRQALDAIPANQHVLIAGPTASGKSALALAIAEDRGGHIVNADASQVYECWRIITARPSVDEEARAPHRLYGHISPWQSYSTGHWLREVTTLLNEGQRLIIVGGTGLYFSALTEGLADIPPVPTEIRRLADQMEREDMLRELDHEMLARLDTDNRARVQRAWEVQQATGRSLFAWQADKQPALLPTEKTTAFVIDAPKTWLTPRIEARFDVMIREGALEEVERQMGNIDPSLPAFRAIGVPELVAHLRGDLTLEEAKSAACIATRRYAKRQRTWFRSKMQHWTWLSAQQNAD